VALNTASLAASDKKALDEFNKKLGELRRVVSGSDNYRSELANKMNYIRAAVLETSRISSDVSKTIYSIEDRLKTVNAKLNGDVTLSSRDFETLPSINDRIDRVVGSLWSSTSAPTQTMLQSYEIAAKQFTPVYNELKSIGEEIKKLEDMLEKSGAPYTPGRLPEWKN
jgi:ABC-type transporter Mla subunit MlaD